MLQHGRMRHAAFPPYVEDVFFGKNLRTTVVLSHARGVVLLTAEEAGVAISEYPPALVKKTVVGVGHADKAQVASEREQLDRLVQQSDNLANGIALFRAGSERPAAEGWFVHVFVDRATRRPIELPAPLRAALERLLAPVAPGT